MSEATKEALETALDAHIRDETEGKFPTDWLLISAATQLSDIGTGVTSYFIEANTNQPVHVTLGLAAYIAAHGPFRDDDDWTEDENEGDAA